MARPPKFSRQQLQRAALVILDEHGLSRLTMRSLAAALGTGPMTLYNHVTDRADLETLVVDAVMGEVTWEADDHRDWRAEAREIASALWRTVRAHPHAIPLIATRASRSPATYDVMEALLRALSRGGHADRRLLVAFRVVTGFVMGAAQAEITGPLAVEAGESAGALLDRYLGLGPETYPHLVAIAPIAMSSDPDAEFQAGLEVLLAGLALPPPSIGETLGQ